MDLTNTYEGLLPNSILDRYEVKETRGAAAVLKANSLTEFNEIIDVLAHFTLLREDITVPGGNRSSLVERIDNAFRDLGWREASFEERIVLSRRVSGDPTRGWDSDTSESEVVSTGYKLDNVKESVALDTEWNAKDGNLDRDLAAYRTLYDRDEISCGVIICRHHESIKELALELGVQRFNTSTTTTIEKLSERLVRGDAGGCPILSFGIKSDCLLAG